MGYWGYGVMDGDTQRDVRNLYKDNLYRMATKDEAFTATKDEVLKAEHEASIKVLALAYIEMESLDRLSEDVMLAVIIAIAYESMDAVVSQWKEPQLRLDALNKFAEQVEIYRKKGSTNG